MIICVYKPIRIDGIIDNYEIVNHDSIYQKGSYFYRVVYKCDGKNCKNKNKLYSINRDKLSEKRSKTVNEKIQICRSCQTIGENNPRYGDNRKWEEIYGKEKSDNLKIEISNRFKGDKNPSKNPDIIKKKNENNFKKYGVYNVFQLDFVKEKSKKSSFDKYGYEYPMMSDEIKDKYKKTSFDRYGVEHPMMLDFFKKRVYNSSVLNHGVYHTKLDEIKNKIKSTCEYKYNVDNYTKSENYRKEFKISNDVNYIKYLESGYSLFKCDKGHNFDIKSDNYLSRVKSNLPICTICNPIGESNSIKQKEILSFISDFYKKEINNCYRDKKEIDIYLPDLKLGFEFNGLYWHSEEKRSKTYHLDKTNFFKEKGIRIIHIWEDDWLYKQDIIKSQIKNMLLKIDRKIYARNCKIVILKNVSNFLEKNHIQGKDKSNLKLGLLYNNELVSVMTFNHLEGRNKMSNNEWNLSRFCNLLDTNVIGGASKLLNYFIKNFNPKRIISYADKDWSIGNLYFKLNFNLKYETKPDYKYIIDGKRKHKQNFKKKNLNVNISESSHMSLLGIKKIYDCGKMKFEMIL